MKNILTIAKRETSRFRSRFKGGSKLVVIAVVLAAVALSFIVYQQGLMLSKGIYTIGMAPGGPDIKDGRFTVMIMDRSHGYVSLYDGYIDAYIDGESVLTRKDKRSLYAAGALKQYFEKAELTRIKESYDLDRAFPLRIEVNYLETPQANSAPVSSGPAATTSVSASSLPLPTAIPTTVAQPASDPVTSSSTDAAVKKQIELLENGDDSAFKAEFVSDKEIIVPSLMNPPMPLAQVIIAFLYIIPIFFISIFFTSSFMEEKTNRKLNILMSSPVSPFEIITGKLLPYFTFSIVVTVAITLLLKGDVLMALAIFLPIILFIFSIYLVVALVYRTFKDQTFFSMTAITFVTGYLVFPALFSGVNNLCYISPLTLAVQMYRAEPFGLKEYLFATGPMYLVFVLTMFVAVRIFNEEYLLKFGPLYRKIGDAIYMSINKNHLYTSITLLSVLLIPVVFMLQLVFVALSVNLPTTYTLGIILLCAVVIEEVAKSAGIATLIENKVVSSFKTIAILSFLSAFGFLVGEKLLMYLSLSVISNTMLIDAISNADLLFIPLIAHFVFTLCVCLITKRFGIRSYPVAIIAGTAIHYTYNLYVLGMIP